MIKNYDNFLNENTKYFIEYFNSVNLLYNKLPKLSAWLHEHSEYDITGLEYKNRLESSSWNMIGGVKIGSTGYEREEIKVSYEITDEVVKKDCKLFDTIENAREWANNNNKEILIYSCDKDFDYRDGHNEFCLIIYKNNEDFLMEGIKRNIKDLLKNIKSRFGSESDMEKLETELMNLLNEYKEKILDGQITKIDKNFIDKLKDEFNKETIEYLNLDTFFRGINNLMVKGKQKKIEQYFDDYLSTIPTRLKTLYNAEKNISIKDDPLDVDTEDIYYDPYLDDEEFKEWREVISMAPRFRIKRRRFEIEKNLLHIELLKMRDWLEKNNKKLVIVLEGRDAAGKGSFIKTATENLHPGYFKINTFGIPTAHEKEHWFERYEKVLPTTQQIAFYDRSWYNRAVVEPVMGYCTKEQYEKFMKEVLPFEYDLIDNGYYIIKLWFSITDATQTLRFKLRQTSPIKYWKFSPNDAKAIEKWDAFTAYKEEMFRKTSTEKSPWVVVDSNDKRTAKLNAMKYILNIVPYENKNMERLDVYPEVVFPII